MAWARSGLVAALVVLVLAQGAPASADHERAQTAQSTAFLEHKQRHDRFAAWASRNPRLDAGITEIIVRRETLPEEIGEDLVVTRLVFYNRVFFGHDRASLNERGAEVVRAIATILANEPNPPAILVAGHTDSTGPESYNARLAERRATRVAYKLVDEGVPTSALHVIAMGEIQPIASNASRNGRAVNRRIELYVSAAQQANELAAIRVPFDPCHRNDHPDARRAEHCVAGGVRVTVESLADNGKLASTGREVDLGR